MSMTYIRDLSDHQNETVTLKGWVYNVRNSKSIHFLEVRDGSGICQCIVASGDVSEEVFESAGKLKQESSIEITGNVHKDDRSVGGFELHVTSLRVIQFTENYPITPNEHGIEFLMESRHLWLRSRRQWAAMRVRNDIIFAIHTFFQNRGFLQMDSPIFTGNAAEGSTTLFATDYFDEKAYLAQTGQLYGEALAMAHGLIYTFGPTFRAEKSKTRRHLTEFWMIEPEMAFYDLTMNMDLAEAMIKAIINTVLDKSREELAILERDLTPLQNAAEKPFVRMTYTEAVEQLKSDQTSSLLEEMEESRRLEMEENKTERERTEEHTSELQSRRHLVCRLLLEQK